MRLRLLGPRPSSNGTVRASVVLALEVATAWWPATSSVGNTQTDPRDEHRQPPVGSATNPWRAAETRHRDRTDEREFANRYNETWLATRRGYRTPAQGASRSMPA